MTTTALDTICRELEAHSQVDEWVVHETAGSGSQLYLIGVEPEAVRRLVSSNYEITIYRDHEGGRGEAQFKLGPGELVRLGDRLDEAVFMAGLSASAPFKLPAPAHDYPQVERADPAFATNEAADETIRRVRDEVAAALEDETGVRLSSLELFLDHTDSHLRSSNSANLHDQSTHATLEVVLIAHHEGTEAEAFTLMERRRVADLDLANLIRRRAQHARDSIRAVAPQSGSYPVVIDAEAMLPFFGAVQSRSSAAAKYRGSTNWEVGAPIVRDLQIGSGYDPLQLTIDSTLPFGLRSREFDEETVLASRFPLIKDGILQRYWATARYAQYLDIEPTGGPGNVILGRGSQSTEELLQASPDGPVLRVISFSWLTPDAVTGNFSGEIRFGYQITPEGTFPVRGGAVSGNAFAGLTHAHFARETAFLGNYQGPAVARFDGFSIAGS